MKPPERDMALLHLDVIVYRDSSWFKRINQQLVWWDANCEE